MTKIIIDIFMYIFEAILLLYYSSTLFERKHSNFSTIILALLINTVLCAVYQVGIVYLNAIVFIILNAAYFKAMHRISMKTALFHTLIFIIVMFASEILVMGVGTVLFEDFNALEKETGAYIFVVVLSKIIYFAIMMLILKMFAQKEHSDKANKFYWLLFTLPLSSTLMLLAFRYAAYTATFSKNMSILSIVASIGILFSNIFVFIIYEYAIKNAKKLYEFQAVKQKQDIEQQYLDILEQNNKDLKIFTHDIKNHLEQIGNLAQDEEIREYISKLYGTVNQYSNVAMSGNKTLDVIISKYKTLCEKKNIEISFNVKTANLSDIDSTDLSTVMNNLLDNAVESAEKSKEKIIRTDIYTKNAFEIVKIKNSCDTAPHIINKKLVTDKKDKSLHGFGIESVKRTIKNYDGMFDWNYNEKTNVFETTIIFPKNE